LKGMEQPLEEQRLPIFIVIGKHSIG